VAYAPLGLYGVKQRHQLLQQWWLHRRKAREKIQNKRRLGKVSRSSEGGGTGLDIEGVGSTGALGR
jgi:hypothetical protein